MERLQERRASVKRLGDPKYIIINSPAVKPYDVLAATALHGCGTGAWAGYMIGLANEPDVDGRRDLPTEMFALPPLVRYLYQFGDCLSDAQKQAISNALTSKPQSITGHGTLNHAIVKASSHYLLAQYFPNAKWQDKDTPKVFSSAAVMALLKPLMLERTKRFYRSGHNEFLSPTYAIHNLFPLLNWIDFASDPQVRLNAGDEAILAVTMLRVHSFYGVIVPPFTRKNFEQHNALDIPEDYATSVAQQALWYYFGEPAGTGCTTFIITALRFTHQCWHYQIGCRDKLCWP